MRPHFAVFAVLHCIAIAGVANAEEVSGVLDGDTTWSAASNPYQVVADVTVPDGATLIIEPGVQVELAAETSIVVAGELVARGTEDEPIVFTHAGNGNWNSIVFEDTAVDAVFEHVDDYVSGSIIEHCTLEFGTRALHIHGSSPYVVNSTFTDNFVPFSVDPMGGPAITVDQGGEPRIRGNSFFDNEAEVATWGGAIFITASEPIIQDNMFTGNSSVYGGAITNDVSASPIVGNTFEDNVTVTKGGALCLVSGISAVLNNTVTNNEAGSDGGGIHVCIDCYPHAVPFVMDNTITDNVSTHPGNIDGAAGIGAAFIRVFSNNNIHGNTRQGEPFEFGWFHNIEVEGYPSWVYDRAIGANYWGTADEDEVADLVFDGTDDDALGVVTIAPPLSEPVTEVGPRVIITTRKLRYEDDDDPMPVYLTLYNPNEERDVELAIMLQYGEGAPTPYTGPIDYAGAENRRGLYPLTMPENSVYFSTIMAPIYDSESGPAFGYWHASLFDAETGELIGDTISIRFDFVREAAE